MMCCPAGVTSRNIAVLFGHVLPGVHNIGEWVVLAKCSKADIFAGVIPHEGITVYHKVDLLILVQR